MGEETRSRTRPRPATGVGDGEAPGTNAVPGASLGVGLPYPPMFGLLRRSFRGSGMQVVPPYASPRLLVP